MQGIEPEELIKKNINQIKEMYKGRIRDNETLELQLRHYEEKRKEKIRILLEERAELIITPKNPRKNTSLVIFI